MSVLYRFENLVKYKKDGVSYLEEMQLIDSELGLSFKYIKKDGDKEFYKIEAKKPENGVYKVTETKNNEVETMEISDEELLKLFKINKKLKFVEDYVKKDRKKYVKENKMSRQKKRSKK